MDKTTTPLKPKHEKKQYRSVWLMLLFGAISLSAYLLLFMNEELVTDIYTKGNWYAIYPIVTALFFSFIHGAFASHLISSLGLEEKK
ncbi:MAG: hypothetical protein H8E38_08415 [SAR324 cluster bacterium]|nr:hypothetical protein [SAR324 cluster bacterium]